MVRRREQDARDPRDGRCSIWLSMSTRLGVGYAIIPNPARHRRCSRPAGHAGDHVIVEGRPIH
jgi:hypothetical protein